MKVLIIDDHVLFRDGLHLVLKNLSTDLTIFNADSYEDSVALMAEHNDLDLVLLDLSLPGLSDCEALKAVRKALPFTPVVILSGNETGEKVEQVLNLGAQGYIPKSSSADILINSLKFVLSGGIYIPPEILSINRVDTSNAQSDMPTESESSSGNIDDFLTPRQQDVLQQLVHGYSNKEIGKQLNMSESTVRVHMAAILKSFGVTNRTRAVNMAIQNGWSSFSA